MHSLDKKQFLLSVARGASYVPLAKSWPADLETPLTPWLKVGNDCPPGVLLESVEGGETIGRECGRIRPSMESDSKGE